MPDSEPTIEMDAASIGCPCGATSYTRCRDRKGKETNRLCSARVGNARILRAIKLLPRHYDKSDPNYRE